MTVIAIIFALVAVLFIAFGGDPLADPLTHNIPDDIPGTPGPNDDCLFGEVEPRKGPTDE